MRYNGGDVIIYALGNFLRYGSLYPQNSKSIYAQTFASKR
jgi:hypothetical protein